MFSAGQQPEIHEMLSLPPENEVILSKSPKPILVQENVLSTWPFLWVALFDLFSLHILSMWETICDAKASWASRILWPNWQEHPILKFGTEYPSQISKLQFSSPSPNLIFGRILYPQGYHLVPIVVPCIFQHHRLIYWYMEHQTTSYNIKEWRIT